MNRIFASIDDIRILETQPYDAVVPVTSTYALVERSARLWGARPALTFLEHGERDTPVRTVDYATLLANVRRAANLFRALGVGPDEAVAILAPNLPEAHYALWGAEIAGRACPINHLLNVAHIAALLKAANAKVLVALGPNPELDIWSKVAALQRAGVTQVLQIAVERAGIEGAGDGAAAGAGEGTQLFQRALAAQPDQLTFDPALTRGRIAACYHTGGTTGAPKLALHTHGNQVHTSWFAPRYYGFDEHTVEINGFPLFHVAGAFVYGLSCLAVGAQQILPALTGMRNTTFVRNYWHHCERFGVTALAGVPTVLAALMNVPRGSADISTVRIALTGGSPLPTELADQFEAHTGLPVRNILGMTESAGLLSIGPLHAPRVSGSTGLRLPYSEIKAVRVNAGEPDFSQPCAADETGIIVARGPHVSPGYTDAQRNAGIFTADGWLISGDLGHVDAAGNIFVTGRAKDVIIRGAHNIDPGMVEEAFLAHPDVSMCAVVGEPDAYAGELPVAFITLKPGANADTAEILAAVAPHIAERPAVPKRVTVIDAMPMTAIGKIYKPALRLRAIETKLGEMLMPLAGSTVRVQGHDDGGVLSAVLHLVSAQDQSKLEDDVRKLLGGIALRYTFKRES